MDGNSNYLKNRQNDPLGVNKMGKNIRKSPLHQPNFGNPKQQSHAQSQQNSQNQQPQPQVYNISKNDFRSIVQQLTGTPTRDPIPNNPPPPRPSPINLPKPPSNRLHKIRPPPLTPIARPPVPHPHPQALHNSNPTNNPIPYPNPNPNPNSNFFPRPTQQLAPFSPLLPPTPPGSSFWGVPNTAESPVSAYMRYLENSMMYTDGTRQSPLPLQQHQLGHAQLAPPLPSSSGLLPTPPAFPSPRGSGPSPQMSLLPSPSSQFVLPSPSTFLNLLSPRSPYPSLSPRFQYSPLLTPNFSFSPLAQSGILGPGPQPPLSPGLLFPPSPSGFPIMSPRWRDM